ncbi:tea1 [Symbiodinium natans]|uniref:Tea1 protein n=1 Tax=Symbiodinium natans TaxID=878477 RepID=A0A812JBF8_9DINO|nr:tea1 [Symbiodinium natans]
MASNWSIVMLWGWQNSSQILGSYHFFPALRVTRGRLDRSFIESGLAAAKKQCLHVPGGCSRDGSNVVLQDVWEYWPSNASWRDVTPSLPGPGPRWRHTLVWSESDGGCLLFAGASNLEVWLLQPNASGYQWSAVSVVSNPSAPGNRLHTAVAANVDGQSAMLVYGGIGGTNPKQRLFAFFPHNGTWTTRANGPGSNSFVRYSHTAVWAAELNLMLVFGGAITGGLNDLHAYSPATDTWQQLGPSGALPNGRLGHVAVWTGSAMIVASGQGGNEDGAWVWRPVPDLQGSWEKTSTSVYPGFDLDNKRGAAAWDPFTSRMFYGFRGTADFWWSYQLPG